MKAILLLLLVLLIVGGVYWYSKEGRQTTSAREVGDTLATETERMKRQLNDKLVDLSLHAGDIREELARTGKVVRKKALEAQAAIVDATADARTTAAIKGKLVVDPDLSALSISVNTTEGIVTLSGTVSAPEDIGKAIRLALDQAGAKEVVSTLQIKPK